MELQQELAQLESHLREQFPELASRLEEGLSISLIQETESQLGKFLPRDVVELFAWKNGTRLLPSDNGCVALEFIPHAAFRSFDFMTDNVVKSSLVSYIQQIYVKHDFVKWGESLSFAPIMATTDFQMFGTLDYLTLCVISEDLSQSLPLVNYDSCADAGLPIMKYDSVLSMVNYLNQMYSSGGILPLPTGDIDIVDIDLSYEVWAQTNPICREIEVKTYY